jgi:signal transduction histidine kinase
MLDSEKPLILVADDDPLLPQIITPLLQGRYRIEVVTNGKDCLDFIDRHLPDLILLDAVMPSPDGFECCCYIRSLRNGKDIPILMITHLDDPESIDRAFAVGATDFIPKPIHWVVLQHRIQRLLENHALHQQNLNLIHELDYEVKIRNSELQEASQFEFLLRVITDKVRSSLREEDILLTAIQELTKGLQLGGCLVGILNLDDYSYEILYEQFGTFSNEIKAVVNHLDPEVLPHLLLGHSVLYSQRVLPKLKITTLCCGLLDKDTSFGFLSLIRSAESTFTDLEIRLVEQIASQCVIGIRQSRLYQAVEQQVIRLSQLNQVKDEFVHLVSHELRTPLTNMKMALKMLDLLPQTEKNCHYLKILHSEWQRELDLVNDLLDLQDLESDTRSLELQAVTIESWLNTFLEPFQMRFQERQQHFRVFCELDHTHHIVTDLKLLDRILAELLNNACKYTPSGESVTLTVNLSVSDIQFHVCNTGVEIPKDKMPYIFDKFTRIRELDHHKQGGTGLGLALVKKAIESLKGKIRVCSQEKLTCFEVELPALVAVL